MLSLENIIPTVTNFDIMYPTYMEEKTHSYMCLEIHSLEIDIAY